MRMINDINEVLGVEEVLYLDATPIWKPDNDIKNAPDFFMVSVRYAFGQNDDEDDLGEYTMDGTMETYKKSVADFNRICRKAAKEGYFCLTDFKGFEVY